MCISSLRCFFALALTATLIVVATLSIPALAAPSAAEGPAAVGLCPMLYPGASC